MTQRPFCNQNVSEEECLLPEQIRHRTMRKSQNVRKLQRGLDSSSVGPDPVLKGVD